MTSPSPVSPLEQLYRLGQFARRVASREVDTAQGFQLTLTFAMDITAADYGSIYLLDPHEAIMRLAAIRGAPEDAVLGTAHPLDFGIAGLAVMQRRSIIVNDAGADPRYVRFFAGAQSELAVPLLVGEDTIGVLSLESSETAHFTAEHVPLIETLGSLMGAAIRTVQATRAVAAHPDVSESGDHAPLVFVLMPFRDPFNKYYTSIFRPAVDAAGMRPLRADEIFGPGEIMRDLWESLQASRIVLAELTGRNPNVMYEVGLAHGIGKPVVLVAQSIEDVPFDLRALRCILYDTTEPDWAQGLRDTIARSLLSPPATGPYQSQQRN